MSKSVLVIEKTTKDSTRNSFQDHPLWIDEQNPPWRRQRSKSETAADSFQDHPKKSGNLHGEKASKSVISRPSTKCVKNQPKPSNKAIEPHKVKSGSSFQDHYGHFKTIQSGSSKKDTFQDHFTHFKTIC